MSDGTLDSIEILSDTLNKRCCGKMGHNKYLMIYRFFVPNYLS